MVMILSNEKCLRTIMNPSLLVSTQLMPLSPCTTSMANAPLQFGMIGHRRVPSIMTSQSNCWYSGLLNRTTMEVSLKNFTRIDKFPKIFWQFTSPSKCTLHTRSESGSLIDTVASCLLALTSTSSQRSTKNLPSTRARKPLYRNTLSATESSRLPTRS